MILRQLVCFIILILTPFWINGQSHKTLRIELDETIFGLPKVDSSNLFYLLEIDENKENDTIIVKKETFSMKFMRVDKKTIHCYFESKLVTAEGDFFIVPQPIIGYILTYDFNKDKEIIRKVISHYLVLRQGKWKFVKNGKTTFQNNNFELID